MSYYRTPEKMCEFHRKYLLDNLDDLLRAHGSLVIDRCLDVLERVIREAGHGEVYEAMVELKGQIQGVEVSP